MPYVSPFAGPKTKRIARDRFVRLLFDDAGENDTARLERTRRIVPDAWHVIELDVDVEEPKEKVTLYLDRSVARLFRGMGKGYQDRINRILVTWAQMKIADLKVMELSLIEALEIAKAEREGAPPVSQEERRVKSVEDNWAYLQGFEDGMLVGRGERREKEA